MSQSSTPDHQETQSEEDDHTTSEWKKSVSSICDLSMEDNHSISPDTLQEASSSQPLDDSSARTKLLLLNEEMFNNLHDQLNLSYETKSFTIPKALSQELQTRIKEELIEWKLELNNSIDNTRSSLRDTITDRKLPLKDIGIQMINKFTELLSKIT